MFRFTPALNAMIFAGLAHAAMHMFTAYYFTIVLALERDWQLPYSELIALWTPAAILVGVASLPMGWLSDRWRPGRMIAIAFIGMGAASVAAGFTDGPLTLMFVLALLGLFGAVYHPVGIPWIMRTAKRNPGKAIAMNGVFGGIGVGIASLSSGALIDLAGWQAAFIVPGVISVAIGVAMMALLARGRIEDPRRTHATDQPARTKGDGRLRGALLILFVTFVSGMIYQSTQTVAPKLFEMRVGGLLAESTFGVGVLVFAVFFVSGFGQLFGGWLADRWSWRGSYLLVWCVHMPMLWLAAVLGGPLLAMAVLILLLAGNGAIPPENLLFGHYTPERHHGTLFGLRYVLSLGAAPIAVQFVAFVVDRTGDFAWLYWTLAAGGCAVLLAILALPPVRPEVRAAPAPRAVPAE